MKSKQQKGIFALFLALVVLLSLQGVFAQEQQGKLQETTVYFFWGEGCPHCAAQEPFMKTLENKYSQLNIVYLETWHNETNAELLTQLFDAHGIAAGGVPATFIGTDKPIVGYRDAETTGKQIEQKIQNCLVDGCEDSLTALNSSTQENNESTINIPVIGEVDATSVSLPVFTIIIAGLDSFNPCAFFVLLFLLSMLVYAGSRKRMLLVGGIFIFFSGAIYFLFMAAWLNIFLWTGEILWITMAAGILAVIIAIINVKDFFIFKKGVSLSIPESAKPKLFQRMRGLIKESSLWSVILGTVVLAIVANMYELLCTAGFPMVFTRVLTLNELSSTSYYMYLLLYNLVYIIPLAIIVGIFTYTLGSRKLSEYEGRVLKLMSGMMMLMLGLVLVFKPSLMNNVLASIILIVLALAVSFGVVLIHKRLAKHKKKE
ncbi:MAG: hypothetical protein ACP5N3_00290 [Candidatus Nanoarchaeia archaeon]